MWRFLGLLVVSVVSGADGSITVRGVEKKSVLLPCNCSFVNSEPNFHWQKERDNKTAKPIINYTRKGKTIYDNYTSRVKFFKDEYNTNCSIQLDSLTADDRGQYRCSYNNGEYQYYLVDLETSESSKQNGPTTNPEESLPSTQPLSPRRFRIGLIFPIGLAVVLCLVFFLWKLARRWIMRDLPWRSSQSTADSPPEMDKLSIGRL